MTAFSKRADGPLLTRALILPLTDKEPEGQRVLDLYKVTWVYLYLFRSVFSPQKYDLTLQFALT